MLLVEKRYAFFIDIDGTLTSDRFEIPSENILWLNRAREEGHLVFINTGRSLGNIPRNFYEQLTFADGVICGNGSHVIVDGRDVYKSFMKTETVLKAVEYFTARDDLWCVLEGERELFLIEDSRKTRKDTEGKVIITSVEDYARKYADAPIEVIACGPKPPEDFEEKFSEEFNVYRIGHYADCVSKGCSKVEGMNRVCRLFGIAPDCSVAIGDSENDREMLLAAGLGIAMGNAPESIRAVADSVTLTNAEAGVAEAVKKLIFR